MKVKEGVFTVGGKDYAYYIELFEIRPGIKEDDRKINHEAFRLGFPVLQTYLGNIPSIKGLIVQGKTENETETELIKSLQIKLEYDKRIYT